MSLAEQLLEQIANPNLTLDERARLRIQLSKALEESGNYEGAREAMGELWSRIGERPELNGLNQETAAEVLLQIGILTSCIGSVEQTEGAQEIAKDLITESIAAFEALNQTQKVAEAQTALALCYWRQGALDDARVVLKDALSRLTDNEGEHKAVALLRSAIVETSATRFNDSLRILIDAAPLFAKSENQALRGRFHGELAFVLRNLGAAERRQDYIDRALIEYAAASYHFEQAGHKRYLARVENNLGFLFSTVGKFDTAHEHTDRARRLFISLNDSGSVAQVDETRARVLLAEGRVDEAEKIAHAAVKTLEKGDERSLLAEALTTHGKTLARLGRHARARLTLQHAVIVAEQTGDRERAGQAALTIIEELGEHSTPEELKAVYERAVELLADSRDPGIPTRLASCARLVMREFVARANDNPPAEFNAASSLEGISFKDEIRRYERFLIERALKEAGGMVTRAAQLLGFRHHYSLITLMNHRHKDLLPARTPVVPRRRSIFRDAAQHSQKTADKSAQPVTILHVEDNKTVAGMVQDILEAGGWKVDSCVDGLVALTKLVADAHYDLLLLDNDLPGLSGLELLRLTRKLAHRRRTPVIILSSDECEAEAWRAGANAFLRKPEAVSAIPETISRLLKY